MTGAVLYPTWAAIDPEAIDAPLKDEIQWFQALSVPVLPVPSVAGILSCFDDPEERGAPLRDELQWYQELSVPAIAEPDRTSYPSAFDDATQAVPAPPTVTARYRGMLKDIGGGMNP